MKNIELWWEVEKPVYLYTDTSVESLMPFVKLAFAIVISYLVGLMIGVWIS